MSWFTHFLSFCFGIVFTIGSAFAVFYLVILQKIAKNELYLREMTAPRIIALFTRRVQDRPTDVVRERINEVSFISATMNTTSSQFTIAFPFVILFQEDVAIGKDKEKEKDKKVEEKEAKEKSSPEVKEQKVPEARADIKGEMDPIALAIKSKQVRTDFF